MEYIWPCRFKTFWDHLVHLFQNGLYLKMVDRRVKRREIWDSWILTHIWDTFDLLMFQVMFGSCCALVKMACNSKRLPIQRNRLIFGTCGVSLVPSVSIVYIYFIRCLIKGSLAFKCQMRISHFSYIASRYIVWLLGINLACSNLARVQA